MSALCIADNQQIQITEFIIGTPKIGTGASNQGDILRKVTFCPFDHSLKNAILPLFDVFPLVFRHFPFPLFP